MAMGLMPPDNRGYAPGFLSSVSDRLHRIQVARPTSDPPGITTVEQYRVARSPTLPTANNASSNLGRSVAY